MAAAGRESHRSTSAERTLLSPPGRECEEGAERSRAGDDESIFGGDPAGFGAAGREAGVGNVEALYSDQRTAPRVKKPAKRGRRKNKSSPGGPSEVAAAVDTTGGDMPATASAAASEGEEGGEVLDAPPAGSPAPVAGEDGGLDGDGMESARTISTNKLATRERSQQMYEKHRQTQVSKAYDSIHVTHDLHPAYFFLCFTAVYPAPVVSSRPSFVPRCFWESGRMQLLL